MQKWLIIVASILCSSVAFSQKVVLINGVPTQVTVDGDVITSVGETVQGYMTGYENSVNDDFQQTSVRIQNEGAVAEDSGTFEEQSRISIETGNYLKFNPNLATLTALAINEIKDYASKITNGDAKTVTLESFYLNGNAKSEELVRNRLDACKKFFELNGIQSNLILTRLTPDVNTTDKVVVLLR